MWWKVWYDEGENTYRMVRNGIGLATLFDPLIRGGQGEYWARDQCYKQDERQANNKMGTGN